MIPASYNNTTPLGFFISDKSRDHPVFDVRDFIQDYKKQGYCKPGTINW
jgi:hypothetical protein